MPFQKGNTFGKGGRQNPAGGRPTKAERAAKEEMVRVALDSLKVGMGRAVQTLLKHLDSQEESISLRAAQSLIDYALRAHECDELEARIKTLEAKIIEQGQRGYR
jgi:hypothetical protein